MISSVYIRRRGSHAHLTVRWKGKTAGTLVVDRNDEADLLRELTHDPATIEIEQGWEDT